MPRAALGMLAILLGGAGGPVLAAEEAVTGLSVLAEAPEPSGSIVEGQREGRWQRIDAQGAVLWEGDYRSGVLDGRVVSRHADGRSRFDVEFDAGRPPERLVWAEAGRGSRLDLRYPRRISEIVDHLARHYPTEVPPTRLVEQASLQPPYAAGATRDEDRQLAFQVMRGYRFLSGVEWEHLELYPALGSHCQHGAVLLRRLNSGSHLPPRPADMDQDFYRVAAAACKKSSIHGGSPSMAQAIWHFMAEVEPHNHRFCGHRRFALNPHMNRTGFGFVGNLTLMWAHDMSRRRPADYDLIAYPGEGYYPAGLISAAQPWSVYLDRRRYAIRDPDAVRVRVTELDAGLHPIAEIPVEFVHADDSRQWPTPSVNFRPRLRGSGELAGRRFLVRVDGVDQRRRARPVAWIVDLVAIGEALAARRQELGLAADTSPLPD